MNYNKETINERITFEKGYLEDKFSMYKTLGPISITLLLDLLFELLATDRQDDYLAWVKIAEKWIYEIGFNKSAPENELVKFNFYKYLFDVIRGNFDLNLAMNYSTLFSAYVENHYKFVHSNLDLYEDVLMTFLEIKEFNKARELCERILNVKKSVMVLIIRECITSESSWNQDKLTKKYADVLKRRKDDPLVVKYLQYSFYYRELLRVNSVKEISKGMVFGLDGW